MSALNALQLQAIREYERVLCPGCDERFTVEGYDYCCDCIRLGNLLDAKRRYEHSHLLNSLQREDAGLDLEYREQQDGAIPNWMAWSAISGSVAVTVLCCVGAWHMGIWAWHLGKLAIGLLLEISQ